ncbi:P-type ATPase [Sesbania bispinosa]|nr:P-type ATPase [Sesbania bispinosa]
MRGEKRKKLHLSKIYSFACGRSSFKGDHSQIGGRGYSMVKEGIEDWRRKKQLVEYCRRIWRVNNRRVKVHKGHGTYEDAVCYVETMNLDWETNLKLKQGLEVTSSLHEEFEFSDLKLQSNVKDPNANLYSFVGSMEFEEQQHPLSPQQLLLRDSTNFRNTDYIFGAVVFTGHDTKFDSLNVIWLLHSLSLYVSIEIVKVLQSIFINQDIHMYYEEADKPAHARTSNLNEELGQVDTILSDKTGTLTCNSMEFIKCSIAGVAYGRGVTEVERPWIGKWIMNGNWVNESHVDVIQNFFRLLAICHTAIPEVDEGTGNVSYEAESPDEAAFVIAAREIGFEFYKRTQTSLSMYELDPVSGTKLKVSCLKRLAKDGREFEEKTSEHEKGGDKVGPIAKASRESIRRQISEAAQQVTTGKMPEGTSQKAFALIIDGKSLTYALEDNTKGMFSRACEFVVHQLSVARSSPKQKALVTRLVKSGTGKTTLAIGDGANDVGMLQEADIGGFMSSDIAIAQFRYLERLLLVHGHWCYRRISSMDVSARYCQKFPMLYQEGVQNILFSWRRILGWMLNGFISAIIIFFFCTKAMEIQAFDEEGRTAGRDILGATMYTCVVWVVNLQMALAISYFTLIQHIFIWGTIALWYLFLIVYGAIPSSFSTNAYKVFIETLAPSPSFWIVTLYEGKANDPEIIELVRQGSLRPTTVGSTARLAAKTNHIRENSTNHR